jgi:hypothetical protein
MKNITGKMLKIYVPVSGLDWMNYRLVKEEVTFHHIKKKSDGGKKEINNGALIMPVGHQYLHLIEYLDIDTYLELNSIFKIVNMQGKEPTLMQRGVIEDLLLSFEDIHRWDKNMNGELIIKRKYLKRW